MRASNLGIAAALMLCLGLASPVLAGGYPTPPPQCAGYQSIIDYYAGQSYTGFGLTVKECSQLCKKSASECKSNVAKAKTCSKKAVSDAIGTEIKTDCSTLSGSEKKSCKQELRSDEDAGRSIYQNAGDIAKENCMQIRDNCISNCED